LKLGSINPATLTRQPIGSQIPAPRQPLQPDSRTCQLSPLRPKLRRTLRFAADEENGATGDTRAPEWLEELAVRRVMDRYLACLDRRDFDGIAACFTDDAPIVYLDGRVSLVGGQALAGYLRFVTNFRASNHTVSSFTSELKGASATMDTLALAILLEGDADAGRLLLRGIHYEDWLVRRDEEWLISRRNHGATWQCEADAVARYLPHA
jgi:hypothetical protein